MDNARPMARSSFLLMLFSTSACLLMSGCRPASGSDHDLKQPQDAHPVEELIGKAAEAYHTLGFNQASDSLCALAVQQAEASYENDLILKAYNAFLELANTAEQPELASRVAGQAARICGARNHGALCWRTQKNLAEYYLRLFDMDRSIPHAYEAMATAQVLDGHKALVQSYLLLGQCQEGQNLKIEAFRNYLSALAIAQKHHDDALLTACHRTLSFFFNVNNMASKAVEYKLKEIRILEQQVPIDSVALRSALLDLEEITFHSREEVNEEVLKASIRFASRMHVEPLYRAAMALYRSWLISKLDLEGLTRLYDEDYPLELQRLSVEEPFTYYRVNAYLHESASRMDSAIHYFGLAEMALGDDPNKVLRAHFMIRFAELLLRDGQGIAAEQKLHQAYELALASGFLPYARQAADAMKEVCAGQKDYARAYAFSEYSRRISDSLSAIAQGEDLFLLEIDNATRMHETALIQEEIAYKRSRNIQYTAITVGIIFVFFIVITLGSLAIRSWVKRLMSFLSFVMLFEFIILVLDFQIHHYTQGEPWKILMIKIVLIAILLPLHHFLERRMSEYLLTRRQRIRWMRRKTPPSADPI